MPGTPIRFNCGEYLPGMRPITTPGVEPPSPPVIIIIPPSSGEPQNPYVPTPPNRKNPPYRPNYPTTPSGPVVTNTPSIVFNIPFHASAGGTTVVPTNQIVIDYHQTTTIRINNDPTIELSPTVNINDNQLTTENPNQIYHPYYNFFQYEPTNTTQFRNNFEFNNIFNNVVAKEVSYFLTNNNTNNSWIEIPYFDLTNEKISNSLRPELLTAFNNIHYFGGMKINIDFFLSMVKNMLLENRLSELDPGYYIDLYNRHKNDTFIQFVGTDNKTQTQKVALGILANEAISSDYTQQSDIAYQQLKRQKRLPTDVNAAVSIVYSVSAVPAVGVFESGLQVTYISGTSSLTDLVPLGEGAGYYLGVTSPLSDTIPLLLQNDTSSSYYAPAGTRFNTLSMMEIDPTLTFVTSSLPGVNEFNGNFDYSSIITPLYFQLDLSSIYDGSRDFPLTDTIVATYSLVDSSNISTHANTYGYSVTKLNIDYRDPFLMYARDTHKLYFEQYDITFRAFNGNAAAINNSILTRTMPFAVILTPGCGSFHNPFNAKSRIEGINSAYVSRRVDCIPHISTNDTPLSMYAMDETNLFNDTGSFRVGLVEDNDGQAVTYRLNLNSAAHTKNFYVGGNYTLTHPGDATLDLASNVVKNVIDYLVSSYNPSYLTWWDVLSRLTLTESNRLLLDYSQVLHDYLVSGGRGVPIKNVLNRAVNDYTGLPLTLVPGDIQIVDAQTRANIRNY